MPPVVVFSSENADGLSVLVVPVTGCNTTSDHRVVAEKLGSFCTYQAILLYFIQLTNLRTAEL